MNVLIAGGSGFIGRHLIKSLKGNGHQIWVLSRDHGQSINGVKFLPWDGETTEGWDHSINHMDTIINLSGLGLYNWPWTRRRKQMFLDSRVKPGLALASAVRNANTPPKVFIQISGINHYGLRGEQAVDETYPPGDDYLSQLTVAWEEATTMVETVGVRRIICRTAIVLADDALLLKLMALPVNLFIGGRLGEGDQALPWIHINDQIGSILFLMNNPEAFGVYNLVAPHMTSNAEFMYTLAEIRNRPYWFHVPAFLLNIILGKMSVLVTEGRYIKPGRLIEDGYSFKFSRLDDALKEIYH